MHTNQTSTHESSTNATSTRTITGTNTTTTISVPVGQNVSSSWNPYTEFYNFLNYGLFSDGGDCYGFSSTAILYFEHYQLGDQSAPFYPEPTTSLSALPGETGGDTLSLSTFPIYIHQTYDPSNSGWVFILSNLASSVRAMEQSIRNGMPVILALGPSDHHAVVAYGYELNTNGSVTIMISDPNYGTTPRQALYTNGHFLYEGTYTWTTFAVISPGQIQWSWLLLKGSLSSLWSSTVSQTNPYYTYVFSSVPIIIVGSSTRAFFGTPGDSLTFVSNMTGVVGFEEGGIQVYGIPKGTPYTIQDPGATSSQITVVIPRNSTSVVGYQLSSNSSTPLNLDVTALNSGMSVTSGGSVSLSVSFFSAMPNSFSVFNATSIPVAPSQTAAFSVPSWDRLGSAQSSPTLQVFEPSSTTPVATYTLTDNQGLPQSSALSEVLLPLSLVVVLVVAIVGVVLLRRRR